MESSGCLTLRPKTLLLLGLLASLFSCSSNSKSGLADAGDAQPGSAAVTTAVGKLNGGPPLCLRRSLPADTNTTDGTHILAALAPACNCTSASRSNASSAMANAVRAQLAELDTCSETDCASYCVCEVARATGDALQACLTEADPLPSTVNGWCYIDPAQGIGSADLMAACSTSTSMLRVTGTAMPNNGEIWFLAVPSE